MPSDQQFRATGLTCGHCAAAVSEVLRTLPGVADVDVAVRGGGESTVTVSAEHALTDAEIAQALDEAGGYRLARP